MSALKTWGRAGWDDWQRFWFSPADPATLGLIRIAAGALLFYTHLIWTFDLEDFFGAEGWVSPRAASLVLSDSYVWSYFWYLGSPALLWTAHVAALVAFALLTVGLCTRAASIASLVATLSYAGRVPGALFGLDQINTLLAMYLAVGPSGAAFSLDRLVGRRARRGPSAPSVGANVAIRLIQVHLCIVYLFAGTSKCLGPSWWNGTAMWAAIANFEYQSLDMTWLGRWPRLLNLLTHLTVAWEISYAALIWPARTRPVMLALAVPLHAGIGLCLGMPTFGAAMLIANAAFVPPETARRALGALRAALGLGSKPPWPAPEEQSATG